MLLTKTVMARWNNANRKHYEFKGYNFTKLKDEFEVRVEDLSKGCELFVEVKCDCPDCKNPYLKPMMWQTYLKHVREDEKYYCRECGTKLFGRDKSIKTRIERGKSFEQWCYDNLDIDYANEILSRWDVEKNGCLPSEVTYKSNGKNKRGYWFKCLDHPKHKSELKNIKSFVDGQEGSIKCNACNSFAQWGIDNIGEDFLEKYWNYEKNKDDPWEISCGNSSNKVWIICQEKDYHDSYFIKPLHFKSGIRCSYCSSTKVHPLDSLGQYILDNFGEEFLNKIWSDKNEKSAFEYSLASHCKVWWKCLDEKHDDYYREIDSTSHICSFRCPHCSNEREESILQEKVRLYLEYLGIGEILHENKCTIIPKNPKTKFNLPYDNEINELKLIIEVHGSQHYKIEYFHKKHAKRNKTTPKYELHYQQLKDRYKRMYAKSRGYNYLEIPYNADDKKETWKKMIDDKLVEIINKNKEMY